MCDYIKAVMSKFGADRVTKRYWSFVEKTEGCWGWKGSVQTGGYAVFSFHSRPFNLSRRLQASRFSWFIHNRDIPDLLYVCHHCDNRLCSNPEHLFLGTAIDNMKDAQLKGRVNSHGTTIVRLADDVVLDIYCNQKFYADSHFMYKYKLRRSTVWQIQTGMNYRDITIGQSIFDPANMCAAQGRPA